MDKNKNYKKQSLNIGGEKVYISLETVKGTVGVSTIKIIESLKKAASDNLFPKPTHSLQNP